MLQFFLQNIPVNLALIFDSCYTGNNLGRTIMQKGKYYKNRKDAAKQLAAALRHYRNSAAIVLGIPRGGAEIGYHLAKELNLTFSILIAKKIDHPDTPEHGIGAVCEEGTVYLDDEHRGLANKLEPEILKIRSEILRRVLLYRDGNPLPDINGRIVILADDGIASGVTLASALLLCIRHGASHVVIAVPVASQNFAKDIGEADEIIILQQPLEFISVNDAYEDFQRLNDEQVLALIKKYKAETIRE